MRRREIRAARQEAARRSVDMLSPDEVPAWWSEWADRAQEPDTAESYQRDAIAAENAPQIPGRQA